MHDVIAQLPQNPRCIGAHFVVILDNENHLVTFCSTQTSTVYFDWRLILFANPARQVELNRGAMVRFAVNPDVTSRLLGKAIDHAEAQPASLADRFCREKRVERLGAD